MFGQKHRTGMIFTTIAPVAFDDFDWEDDRPLKSHRRIRLSTRCTQFYPPSLLWGVIRVHLPSAKKPYLKELGVNKLMPVYEFDEFENSRPNPETGNVIELLGLQYGWFLCAQGWLRSYRQTKCRWMSSKPQRLAQEWCIEVILDVVFNHTAEGNENGP